MRRKAKNLRGAIVHLQGLANSGALERSRAKNFAIELQRLSHALNIGDERRVVRSVDRIARLFIKDDEAK